MIGKRHKIHNYSNYNTEIAPNRSSGMRITGGCWRGRKIFCPSRSAAQVRPTTEINRQRLYNWLGETISGALVLDLFAGSGMLSWEALSRGAAQAVLVDLSPVMLQHLYRCQQQLDVQARSQIIAAKLPMRLSRVPRLAYDLIYLDPPFGYNLILSTCLALQQQGLIASSTKLYIECETRVQPVHLLQQQDPGWRIEQQAHTSDISQYIISYY